MKQITAILIGITILFLSFGEAGAQDIKSEVRKAFLDKQEAIRTRDYKSLSESFFWPRLLEQRQIPASEEEKGNRRNIKETEGWFKGLTSEDIDSICNEKIIKITVINPHRAVIEVSPKPKFEAYYLIKMLGKWRITTVQHHIEFCWFHLKTLAKQIEDFQEKYKRLPSGIEEIIEEDPAIKNKAYDIFDDEKNTYRFKLIEDGWRLYSIGPDGDDDGGEVSYNPENGLVSNGDIIFSDVDAVTQATPKYIKEQTGF